MARRHAMNWLWVACLSAMTPGGELPDCEPTPRILKMAQPKYPPSESRVTPPPTNVEVVLTISTAGIASDARVLANDAVSSAKEFADSALDAALHTRFQRVPAPCRFRMRIRFKVAEHGSGRS